ncbi:hypothetical protein CR513_51631, partial [Mucuna pruriens]
MAKNEMKTIGIMIMVMIMMGFAQANSSPPIVKSEPSSVSEKLNCGTKCAYECLPLIFSPLDFLAYPICVTGCKNRCMKRSHGNAYECITSCGLTKSIDVNIDVRGLATNVVDSCLEECQNKQ